MGESSVKEVLPILAQGVFQYKEISQNFFVENDKSNKQNVTKLNKNEHGDN